MQPSTEISPAHQKNADELISDISKLMAEAEEMLSESTSHYAEPHLELYRERHPSPEKQVMARYAAAKAKIAEVAQDTDKIIRTYPYESAAIALGLGLLMGACLTRRAT
jgi:ElaB/YqjD/DUF883 family membrane-anchored ribosome-binding protein